MNAPSDPRHAGVRVGKKILVIDTAAAALTLTVVAICAFSASFANIHALALRYRGPLAAHAWMAPLFVDVFVIVGVIVDVAGAVINDSPWRERWGDPFVWLPKVLVGIAASTSTWLNIQSAPAEPAAQVLAALPAVALFVTTEILGFISRRVIAFFRHHDQPVASAPSAPHPAPASSQSTPTPFETELAAFQSGLGLEETTPAPTSPPQAPQIDSKPSTPVATVSTIPRLRPVPQRPPQADSGPSEKPARKPQRPVGSKQKSFSPEERGRWVAKIQATPEGTQARADAITEAARACGTSKQAIRNWVDGKVPVVLPDENAS